MKTILVVGQTPDIHIERVIQRLEEARARVVLLDRASRDSTVTLLPLASPGRTLFRSDEVEVSGDEIDAVWWRLKPHQEAEFGLPSGVEDAFRWREWKAVLTSLPYYLPDARWINRPENAQRASLKPYQLILARQCGMRVPQTCITNRVEDLEHIPEGEIIYKTLSSFIAPPDKIIYTNKVRRADVAASPDSVRLAPCLFQEYIPKAFELRVTVIDDQIFAVQIDSQALSDTRTDWRKNQFADGIYDHFAFSSEVEQQILGLHRKLGLTYAAYDFIMTDSGELVFLECNPSGQWLWQEEQLPDLRITSVLAAELAR